MIDIKLIREKSDWLAQKAKDKGVAIDVDEILKLDEEFRVAQKKLEDLRAFKNKASEQIARAAPDEKKKLIDAMKEFDNDSDKLNNQVNKLEEKISILLRQIPNPAIDDVKVGKDEIENEILRKVGEPRKFDFPMLDHVTLGEKLDIIDTARAAKVSGSRFGYLKDEGALFEFALINYALNTLLEHGFRPVITPELISTSAMGKMGYLEHGGEQEIYHFSKDDLVLIGTSEQALGPLHMDEILEEKKLPLRYVGFSSCFRREAGAYGKDTRGILRVHQFDKVEMFSFTTPEQSDNEHEFLLALEEKLMQGLELPYQVIKQCTGDLGAPAARKFDIETWIPSENRYRETHSTSTCTDFQARRLKTRYKTTSGENRYVHTLNGTVFAIGRSIIAILENYQEADGSVMIPRVLQPYMFGITSIKPR